MHLGEKGGLLGTILSEIGKMGNKKEGIVTNVDDSAEEQEKYITETFGPHLEDGDCARIAKGFRDAIEIAKTTLRPPSVDQT